MPRVQRRCVVKRTPLKPRSAKRRKRDTEYARVRLAVEARAEGWCEARLVGCNGRGDAAHHILRRSQGGEDIESNLLWVCNSVCHSQIHGNPERSYAMGLLKRRGQTDA